MSSSHRSSAVPLSLLCAGLIVYASLYPFTGWRWPAGSWWSFIVAPWPRYWTGADLAFNLLGYLPFGALVCIAVARKGGRWGWAWCAGAVSGLLLSLSMELLQHLLPNRVPSNVDWALNALGAGLGAGAALLLLSMGGEQRWQDWRDQWFLKHSAGGLALLLLWPLALLFPLPLPLGLGQVLDRFEEVVSGLLDGTSVEPWWEQAFAPLQERTPLLPATEFMVVVLGQLLPCLVLFAVSRPGWRRAVLASGAAVLGLVTTTLSTALNFGPDHALAWATPPTLSAMGVGLALAWVLCLLSPRAAAALGLIAATSLVSMVNQAPPNPYFAQSLQAWEQGRFVHFHGAAQWVGWLWPYAAMLHLWVMTVFRSDER